MKIRFLHLVLLLPLALLGCSKPVVDPSRLVVRSGIVYLIKADGTSEHPFSGDSVSYHTNGQLRSKASFKDGKANGPTITYYENGQLGSQITFKDGKQEGLWTLYYENGQLSLKGNYKDGKEDGLWEKFREDGHLDNRKTYKDGELL